MSCNIRADNRRIVPLYWDTEETGGDGGIARDQDHQVLEARERDETHPPSHSSGNWILL